MQLRKIPLEQLLSILSDLYEDGADYIDISGVASTSKEDPQDVIKITVRPDYMSNEINEEESSNVDVRRLSDTDINDLI
jgi:hypothetical protein